MKRSRTSSTKSGRKFKLAKAAADIAVAKVAQRSRARGINSSSVFQTVSTHPESKFLDFNEAINPALTGVGFLSALVNACAQGVDAVQHVGRQIKMTSVYWSWRGQVSPTTVGGTGARLVVVYDKEANGAAPTIATGATTDMFNEDSIDCKNNLNNRDRFIILVDEIVECVGQGGPQSFYRKGYRKIALPVVFNATTTATITAIQTGSIYAVVWGTTGVTTAGIATTLDIRTRFDDA